jgi:hypothetical protein
MKTKIFWTLRESQQVAEAYVAAVCRSAGRALYDLSEAELWPRRSLQILNIAVEVLPVTRRRNITTWVQAAQVYTAIETMYANSSRPEPVAAPTAKEAQQPALTLSLEALDALAKPIADRVIELLSERLGLLERAQPASKPAAPATVPMPQAQRRPRVLIYGVLAAQRDNITQAWGDRFDLICLESGKRALPTDVAFALGMTDYMKHSQQNKLRARYTTRYRMVTGSSSAANKVLADCWAQLQLKR